MRKAVVLAAGKGSRLYPVTHHIAKPLLPLANKLTLAYIFDRMVELGITDICLVVGENESQMRSALGDGQAFGVTLTYVLQPNPQGLAHAVGFAKEFVNKEPFALCFGDNLFSIGFDKQLERFESEKPANLSVVKWVPDPHRYGVANLDGDKIVKLVEKPAHPESNFAMAGTYFFGPELWDVLPRLKPSARGEYEITDAIQMLIDEGHVALAGEYDGVWYDTGTLDSYLATNHYLTGGIPLVSESAKVTGHVGGSVTIGDGAIVEAHSLENTVILPGAVVEGDATFSGCIIGGKARITGAVTNEILWDGKPA